MVEFVTGESAEDDVYIPRENAENLDTIGQLPNAKAAVICLG